MNVRLQYNLEFSGGIHTGGMLQLNQYQVNLNLETLSEDHQAINIAMDRLRCFAMVVLEDAIFVNQNESGLVEILDAIGANVVTLPADPVDQIVGLMLYCKLNAIMEGVIAVTAISISSKQGHNVWYEHTEDDPIGPLAEEGWWHDPDTTCNNIEAKDVTDNVLKVAPNSWGAEYGLMWPESVDKTQEKDNNSVVYAKFPKNEN